jgi:predicted pyridoxine 5'-phosphate oxidase superfamily flavin-nucleotide-binding protein
MPLKLMDDLQKNKDLIENNPVAFATITSDSNPNIIVVASVKVVSDDEILVSDNYMDRTVKDVLVNDNVCLAVWNSEMRGCKLMGTARYFDTGNWVKYVKNMKENKGMPAKGALLIKVSKIINLK